MAMPDAGLNIPDVYSLISQWSVMAKAENALFTAVSHKKVIECSASQDVSLWVWLSNIFRYIKIPFSLCVVKIV